MVPSIFVCHGGPTLAIEDNQYTSFLKNLGKSIKPKGIVIFTAHFEQEITTISSVEGTYNIESKFDTKRGLDHGAWVILHLMYPEADIPVVQISVNPYLSMERQYEIGKAINKLNEQDILVIGSGSTVHNLRTINWEAVGAEKWAEEFDNWLIDKVEKNDLEALFKYRELAPNAKKAVPREEHLVPLFIAMGSGQEDKLPKLLHKSYEFGTLSYICFEF